MWPVLLIAAALLAAVPVTDRLLAALVTGRIARRIASAASAGGPACVRVAGASFLAQLITGSFREVRIVIPAFAAGGLDLRGLDARLTGVRAPLRTLLAGGAVIAGRVTATTTIALSALGSKLPDGLHLARHGDGLRIAGSVLRMPVYGVVSITAEPRRILVTPRVLGVPSLVGFVIALPGLPPEVVIDSVTVTGSGLTVTMHGDNVRLGGRRADLTGSAEILAA